MEISVCQINFRCLSNLTSICFEIKFVPNCIAHKVRSIQHGGRLTRKNILVSYIIGGTYKSKKLIYLFRIGKTFSKWILIAKAEDVLGKRFFSSDFQGQICGKKQQISLEFNGNFQGQFRWKMIGIERSISWELPEQISLERDWFWADLRNVFDESRCSYSIYSGFIPQYEIVLYK